MAEAEPRDYKKKKLALRANIWLLKLSRHWLRAALIFLGVYAGLPFAAPTLMQAGLTGPASIIYTLYSPFCHQFAFRTFFLYGEQPFYPRSIVQSGVPDGIAPYEDYIQQSPAFAQAVEPWLNGAPFDPYLFSPALQFASRSFVGDDVMGYKMTLCARDISIYVTMFFAGLIYAIPSVRRRLRPAPILIYAVLGLGPIAVDGFSQLLGYPPFSLWEPRETGPYFRVVTGITFGFMNIWLGFPYLEMSMRETREQIEAKLARAGISA